MGFKAITKNTPAEEPPHILSEDDAAIYRGILGQDGVLNIGSKLKSTVISNNKVRVGDGVINVDGHIGRNAYADYEDLTIENGSAGKKRHDLIVASFSTTGSGGLDTYILKVIKGVAGDTGADPAVTKQDIYAGGKLREYPLYRVKLDGLSIVAVEQMFKVIPTVPELETKYNELNSTLPEISRQGYWEICKFPSGLMIQTYYATDVQIQTNGISGALFYTTEPVRIGNFPVPFVETPDIDCHLIKTKGAICFVPGIEQLSITFPGYFYVMSTNQGQNAISFKVRAEGRWK